MSIKLISSESLKSSFCKIYTSYQKQFPD